MQQPKKATTIDDFEILNKLGEGGFGSVYKIKRKADGKIYAMKKVKMLKLSAKEKENALNEIRILASIDCEFVIKYKDAFYNQPTSELIIIMEFADKGDLQGKINGYKKTRGNFEENLVWDYIAQMLQGIKCLHDLNILHRDLKGANIFLGDEGKIIKLGDLNVSKVQKSNFVHTQTGTPYYLSPEVWKGEPYNNKCDVWSLGCVVYEMAALAPPFQANSMEQLYKKVLKGEYSKIPSRYSKELSEFIKMCLIINPRSRPNISQLLELPQVKQRIKVDLKKQEKAQLLKTMKLPYGGLANLRNILPQANYEQKKQEEEEKKVDDTAKSDQIKKTQQQQPQKQPSQTPVVQSSKQQQQQQQQQQYPYNYHQQQRSNSRPGSANQYRIRSQSQDKMRQNPPPNYGYGYNQNIYQQQPAYQQQQQQPRSSSRQSSRERQQQPQTPQHQNKYNQPQQQQQSRQGYNSNQRQQNSRPYSQRCSSQDRLQENYNKVQPYGNGGYYQNQGYYGYGQPPKPAGSGQKPPAGQARPPMAPGKPPVNAPKYSNQAPQFFGRKKSQI